ncbi:MAG: mevalonate kinase [Anaerolineales bacterium]
MPAISASAPGKIILFGEHSVVYGQPAIAVPVTQVQAKAIITARPDRPAGWVDLAAPNIGLEASLKDLPEDHPLSFVVERVFQEIAISRPPAMTIRITSTIPIAAGLGSGAAVSVAIIRALSEFLGQPLPDDRVSNLAYEVEKLHHGTPSGIDNTVITYAMPVHFIRASEDGSQQVETFEVAEPFTMILGDSGIPSPTAITVADVRLTRQADPKTFDDIFESIGEIVAHGKRAIESGDNGTLGTLMDQNQAMLVKLGVSSPELDNLLHAARQAGALGAKLSGGGRGGNMICLVRPPDADRVSEALMVTGATNTITTVVRN